MANQFNTARSKKKSYTDNRMELEFQGDHVFLKVSPTKDVMGQAKSSICGSVKILDRVGNWHIISTPTSLIRGTQCVTYTNAIEVCARP